MLLSGGKTQRDRHQPQEPCELPSRIPPYTLLPSLLPPSCFTRCLLISLSDRQSETIVVDCSDEELLRRATGRRIDP
eukprot:764661-Hanusia_phi.AAC.2